MLGFILRRLVLILLMVPTLAAAEGRTLIVLDASGSMWGQIDGKPKLQIAREALAEVLKGIPPETELGLIAYGHRDKGACDDIETVVAPAPGTAQAISDAAAKLHCAVAIRREIVDHHVGHFAEALAARVLGGDLHRVVEAGDRDHIVPARLGGQRHAKDRAVHPGIGSDHEDVVLLHIKQRDVEILDLPRLEALALAVLRD